MSFFVLGVDSLPDVLPTVQITLVNYLLTVCSTIVLWDFRKSNVKLHLVIKCFFIDLYMLLRFSFYIAYQLLIDLTVPDHLRSQIFKG